MKSVAMYKGENLVDFTDTITPEVLQFTADYEYLAFRSGPNKILVFDMATRNIQKEFTYSEKIVDYSIASNLEYVALVGYYGSFTKIKDCVTDKELCEYKFDYPIHTVEFMSDNSTIIYGLGGIGQVAHMRYNASTNSLVCIRMIENLFKSGTDVTALSCSIDSRFVACGGSLGDYSVKIIDLHGGKTVQSHDKLHTYNVKSVKISKNSRFIATSGEDSSVNILVFK